jgi:predicted small lipoprotein YifL
VKIHRNPALVLAVAISLAACGKKGTTPEEEPPAAPRRPSTGSSTCPAATGA